MTTSDELKFIEKNIWDLSNEELFNQVDAHYEELIHLDKEQTKNEKSQNEHIRHLSLTLEELWKRQQLPYNQNDVCEQITKRLAQQNASKNLRVIVARQLDRRFKRSYNKDPNRLSDTNVTAVTIEGSSQSQTIFERIKNDAAFAKQHIENLEPSAVQDVQEIVANLDNTVGKYCDENKINYVETTSSESELDRLRKNAKGDPIACPTPEGWEQQKPKQAWGETDEETINSLRTLKAKAIYKYACTFRDMAFNSDNHPATLEFDDAEIAKAFDTHREFLESYNDIKRKRDHAQWCEIIEIYKEISKHNAASNEDLDVYGVSCKNCGSRMKPIDKKRDAHRLYYRCPNYYRTEEQFIGCKDDKPVSRKVSKERITEIQHIINKWAVDVWETFDVYKAFVYDFRNYKQPYHTEHTKMLEHKFQNRGN